LIIESIHGAPKLPEGYKYHVHIQHPTQSDPAGLIPRPRPAATVTVRIVTREYDTTVTVAEHTEVTRSHLQGAVVAAATHAYEEWNE
jgi:hypothetical protein